VKSLIVTTVAAILSLAAAPQEKGAPQEKPAAQEKTPYSIKGEAIEACECAAVCPCIWTKDATFGECRGTVAFAISSGSFGKTDLKGIVFAMTVTKSGKNMVQGLGKWEGALYISDKASAEQKKAVEEFVKAKWGGVYAKLDVKSAAMETKIEADRRELTMGKISTIKIAALKNQDGTSPVIENPPFSLYPKLHCAKAEVHTYDDGTSKWDFAGHNAFFGAFDYSSK
jgi:hypothetical protein